MRVRDVLVDPLLRQLVHVELARREHRLAVDAVDRVAVHVGVEERVVLAQLLELAVARHQGVGVPQADVAKRRRVVAELLRRERLFGRQRLLLDLVEPVGGARPLEVVGDVLLLFAQLVRVDDERLVGGGDDAAQDDEGHDPYGDGQGPPLSAPPDVPDERGGEDEGDAHGGVGEGQPDVHVGVTRSEHRSGSGVQQVPAAEQLADRGDDEDRGEQRREVRHGASAELEVDLRQLRGRGLLGAGEGRPGVALLAGGLRASATRLPQLDAPHDEMDDRGEHERRDERRHDVPEHALPERHGEDVERDVVAEDRVLLVPRRLVEVEQHLLPRGGGGDRGEERHDDAHHDPSDSDPAAHLGAARLEQRAVDVGAEVRREPPRQLDVDPDDHEEDGEAGEAQQQLRPDARPEHAAEAHLAEPQPVDVHAEDAAGEGQHEHDDGDDDRPDDATACVPGATWLGRLLLGAERAYVVHT